MKWYLAKDKRWKVANPGKDLLECIEGLGTKILLNFHSVSHESKLRKQPVGQICVSEVVAELVFLKKFAKDHTITGSPLKLVTSLLPDVLYRHTTEKNLARRVRIR